MLGKGMVASSNVAAEYFFTITSREILGYFLATIKLRVATNLEFLQKITNHYYQRLIKDPDSFKPTFFFYFYF